MSETVSYITAAVAGLALGVFYWGGLWWTCRRVVDGRAPAALIAVGYFVRLAVVVGAMYVLMQGSYIRLGIIVGAMLLVRLVMTGLISTLDTARDSRGQDPDGHDDPGT